MVDLNPGATGFTGRAASITLDQDMTQLVPGRGPFVYVGGGGDVAVTTWGGDDVTISAPAGSTLPVAVQRVKTAGTTATGLLQIG